MLTTPANTGLRRKFILSVKIKSGPNAAVYFRLKKRSICLLAERLQLES